MANARYRVLKMISYMFFPYLHIHYDITLHYLRHLRMANFGNILSIQFINNHPIVKSSSLIYRIDDIFITTASKSVARISMFYYLFLTIYFFKTHFHSSNHKRKVFINIIIITLLINLENYYLFLPIN